MQRHLLFAVVASAMLGVLVRWGVPGREPVAQTIQPVEIPVAPPPAGLSDGQVLAATSSAGMLLMITDNGEQIFTVDGSRNVTVHPGASLNLNGPLKASGSAGDNGQVLTSAGGGAPLWKNITDLVTGSSSSTATTTTTTTTLTQTATQGNILIADGNSWESVAIGGDAGLTSAGVLTIAVNAVALGTDTTGNYVATVADAGSSTITVTNGSGEGSAVKLDVIGVTCTDCLGTDQIKDVYFLNSADSLDFDDFEDTLDLDAALTLNQTTNTWTQSYTGTTSDGLTFSATSLTTGTGLDVNVTNTATSDTAVEQVQFDLTNAQATAANSSFAGLTINFTNNPSVAGNTETAVRIQNQATSNTTDNAVAALLTLDNADTSSTGSMVVTDALRIINSGNISGGLTNAINIDDSDVTTDIVLQNDETIDNNTDGTVTITATTTTVTGDLTVSGGDVTGANGAALDVGEATSGDITVTGDLIVADDSFMGISSSAGRIQFDDQSTDEVNILSARLGVGTQTPSALIDASAAEDTEHLRLTDSTNSDSVGLYVGSGTPESVVSAQLGSMYFDAAGGDVYVKGTGDGTSTGWQEFSSDQAHMAKMRQTANQSIPNDAWTKINFDTEEFDVGSIADSTTNDRFDISHTGKYLITTYWYTDTAINTSRVGIFVNGGLTEENNVVADENENPNPLLVTVRSLSAGDYVEMHVRQNYGSSINTFATSTQHQPQMTVTELSATAAGADLAEVYFTDEDIYPSAGTVVALDPARPGAVRRAAAANDPNAIGIVSTKPGMILGDRDVANTGNPVYVALAGRVPVKVNTENGPISPGDYLTASSQPGVAMKATRPGAPIVGQALGAYDNQVEGLIKAFIKNSVLPAEVTTQESVLIGPLPAGVNISRFSDVPRVAGLQAEDLPAGQAGLPETWLRVDFGEAFKQLLKAQPAILSEAIKAAMAMPASGLETADLTQPTVLAALRLEDGHLVAGSADVAGSVAIPEGNDYAVIRFQKEFATVPYVGVVAVGHNEAFTATAINKDEFRIELKQPASRGLLFTWLAVQPANGAAAEFGRRAGEAESAYADLPAGQAGTSADRPASESGPNVTPSPTPVTTPTPTLEALMSPDPELSPEPSPLVSPAV